MLNRGCSREEVTELLDMYPRTTRHKERQARAYAFPLDAFTSHGRPPTETSDEDTETDSEMSAKQRLEAVSEASEQYTPRADASSASMEDHEESGPLDGESTDTDAVAIEVTDAVDASEESLSVADMGDVDAYPPQLQPLVEALAVIQKQQ